jgi:HAD superfamily hydrolase (TIGR01549 family)
MIAVLFDLEGTLVKSPTKEPGIIPAYRSKLFPKFIELGIPSDIVNTEASTAIVYNNALEFAEKNFSLNKVENFRFSVSVLMSEFEVIWAYQSKPFSEAYTVLDQLDKIGIKIGLVTNTCKKATEIMLCNGKLENFFDTIVTRSDVRKIKPDPESTLLALDRLGEKEFFFIGDSELDALAAKTLGGTSIIIKNNPIKRTFFANYFVNSLSEVTPIILATKK